MNLSTSNGLYNFHKLKISRPKIKETHTKLITKLNPNHQKSKTFTLKTSKTQILKHLLDQIRHSLQFGSSSYSNHSQISPSSSSYRSRLIIRQIRHSLQTGEIDAAVNLFRAHAPFVLQDHRLLFRLQKQKFIELLRKWKIEDRGLAIDYLRNFLAPCALNAYPEAYEEFKHVLLAFIYDKDDPTSPLANEWAEKRRYD